VAAGATLEEEIKDKSLAGKLACKAFTLIGKTKK